MLEIILFLLWLLPDKGADAAGKGLAQVFLIGFGIYILITLALMLFNNRACTLVALILATLPIAVGLFGLVRWLKTRN